MLPYNDLHTMWTRVHSPSLFLSLSRKGENVKHGPKLRELRRRVLARTIYSNPPSYITWPFWSRRRKIYYLSGYRAGAKKIASKSGRLCGQRRASLYVHIRAQTTHTHIYTSTREGKGEKQREKESEGTHTDG